jgi:phosphate transport system permease protein
VAIGTETLRAGGPAPARPRVVSRERTRRRLRADRWASRLVVLGGLFIIASILAILFVITAEVVPLFRRPAATLVGTAAVGAPPLGRDAAGVDEYREIAYALTEQGTLVFTPLRVPGGYPPVPIPGLDGARPTAIAYSGDGRHVVGTADGRVVPVTVAYAIEFEDGRRVVRPGHELGAPAVFDPEGKRPILRLAVAAAESGPVTVGQVGPRDLILRSVVEKKSLLGDVRRQESSQALVVDVDGEVTALDLDGRGENLFVGTSRGQVLRYALRDGGRPERGEAVDAAASGAAVTVLDFLLGDRTLVVGTRAGEVSTWQVVPPPSGGTPRLTRVTEFTAHAAPVVAAAHSRRDKGFVTADAAGTVQLHYGTSGQTLLALEGKGPVRAVVFAPKADGLITLDASGAVAHWRLDNPHPETTLRTLFGKVWYEGYAEPEYVWQSTGGTDDFEAKLSLTPLIYGTLKGTFYALLIAVPLSLLAALYVSEFMHPDIRAYVKPVVEIMAALPSVVLGFLAGLWLAPMVERVVPGLLLMPPVLAVAILAALLAWRLVPARVRRRVRPGSEVVLLVPVVIVGTGVAFALGGVVESHLMAGDYRTWLLTAFGLGYDQRNSLVVGIAMGFAVVPIIFTIAEDSLANVPQHLRAGSLALGATRWQTAVRIVLPTASPGIFSAIMIGFGRAVGETMIVLMATGNTPVMDWNIFSGFRALSANIAVELPEAPEGGTLFRVLFLAAFLLFCLTFLVNTAAELVRLRLRARYRYL